MPRCRSGWKIIVECICEHACAYMCTIVTGLMDNDRHVSKALARQLSPAAGKVTLPCSNQYCRHLWTCRNLQSSPVSWLQPGNSWWPGPGAQSAGRPSTPCLRLFDWRCGASERALAPPWPGVAAHPRGSSHLAHEPYKEAGEKMEQRELNRSKAKSWWSSVLWNILQKWRKPPFLANCACLYLPKLYQVSMSMGETTKSPLI